MLFPKQGSSHDEVMARINDALTADLDWRGGKIWSLVYFAGDDVAEMIRDAYSAAIYTNGLGPTAFKSLKRLESEVMGAYPVGLFVDRAKGVGQAMPAPVGRASPAGGCAAAAPGPGVPAKEAGPARPAEA